MKLKDYIKSLQEVENKHGGDLEVVYSIDDEGNSYKKVYFSPSLGCYDDEDREFTIDEEDDVTPDSVCIN